MPEVRRNYFMKESMRSITCSEWHLTTVNRVFNPSHDLRLARAHWGNLIYANCRKQWLMGGNGGIIKSDLMSTVYESPVTRHFRNIAFHMSGGCLSLFEPELKPI